MTTNSRSLLIRSSTLTLVTIMTLFMVPTTTWAGDDDDDADCYSAAVESLDFVEVGITGESKLCVLGDGLKGTMRTRNMTPGNAYTVWWVYIDEAVCPGGGFFGCISTFGGDNPLAVFGRMDSGVTDHKGKLRFADKLDDMRVSSGSQVWFLQFGHGPASDDGRLLARQLLTPEDPGAGAPHLGVDPNGYPTSVAIYELP